MNTVKLQNPLKTSAKGAGMTSGPNPKEKPKAPSLNFGTLPTAVLNFPPILRSIPGIVVRAQWNTTTRTPSISYYQGQNELSALTIAAITGLGPILQKAGKALTKLDTEDELLDQILAYGGHDPSIAPEFRTLIENSKKSAARAEQMLTALGLVRVPEELVPIRNQLTNWINFQHRQLKRFLLNQLSATATKATFDRDESMTQLKLSDWFMKTVAKPDPLDDYSKKTTISSIIFSKPFYLHHADIDSFVEYVPDSIIYQTPKDLVEMLISDEEKANYLKTNTAEKLQKELSKVPMPVIIPQLVIERLGKAKKPFELAQLPMPNIPGKLRIGGLLNAISFKMLTGSFNNVAEEIIWRSNNFPYTEGLSINDGSNLPRLFELNPGTASIYWTRCVVHSTPENDRNVLMRSFMHNLTFEAQTRCTKIIEQVSVESLSTTFYELAYNAKGVFPKHQGLAPKIPEKEILSDDPDGKKSQAKYDAEVTEWRTEKTRRELMNRSVKPTDMDLEPFDTVFEIKANDDLEERRMMKKTMKILNKKSSGTKKTTGRLMRSAKNYLAANLMEEEDLNSDVLDQIMKVNDEALQLAVLQFALMDPTARGEVAHLSSESETD